MDTIVAPITPLITSAVIVLRISGSLARKVYSLLEKHNGNAPLMKPNYAEYLTFKGSVKDDVLVTFFQAPHSYTGEDVVEISFHGNPILVQAALTDIYALGFRPALGGEFSKRAFLNNKLDLTQAEAVAELINAKSLININSAYNGLQGTLKHDLDEIKNNILNMKANIEALLDFPDDMDDNVEDNSLEIQTRQYIQKIKHNIEVLLESYNSYTKANKQVDLALIGKPNVGKSSIMNRILKNDRSIVSSIAGTTRDYIKETIYIGDIPLNLIDTAGMHNNESGDENAFIERYGIEKTKEFLEVSDIILLVLDISKPLDDNDRELLEIIKKKKHIIIGNKLDLAINKPSYNADILISCKEGLNIDKLLTLIKERARLEDYEVKSNILSITKRHKVLLDNIFNTFCQIEAIYDTHPLDMVSLELDVAIKDIMEITGEEYTEKVLDIIFSSFCIGK